MRFSLGFILAISLAGLQFLAIITVVLTSYVSSEAAMLRHARALLRDAGAASIEHSVRFLNPAAEAADLSSRVIETGIISRSDPGALETFLFQHLLTVPQMSGLYYGDEDGNFVFVMRSERPGQIRTKIVQASTGPRATELIWREQDFSVVELRPDPADTFDPRARPWYENAKNADGISWTDPYIFFSSRQPGISASVPVTEEGAALRGVVGVDIQIAKISSFLADLNIGQNGVAMILNQNGDVIAHPDPDKARVTNDDGTLSFAHIGQIQDPVARAAFAGLSISDWDQTQVVEADFRFQGASYLMLALPIQGIDLPWTIAIFAPKNDFIQEIKDNRRRNIWIAAGISLITALAGLTLAELILRPVRAFAVRTALVSQGEVLASEPLPRTY